MSVEYVNPFGERSYQPEVDGMRRWWFITYASMDTGGEYGWMGSRPACPTASPDLRSKRSARRIEKKRRKTLERRERNQWTEVQS